MGFRFIILKATIRLRGSFILNDSDCQGNTEIMGMKGAGNSAKSFLNECVKYP